MKYINVYFVQLFCEIVGRATDHAIEITSNDYAPIHDSDVYSKINYTMTLHTGGMTTDDMTDTLYRATALNDFLKLFNGMNIYTNYSGDDKMDARRKYGINEKCEELKSAFYSLECEKLFKWLLNQIEIR